MLTLRGSDVMLLKESVRELRKAASATEYKIYEKEQEVRRSVEGEVARLRSDIAALTTQLASARSEAIEVAANANRALENAAQAAQEALEQERSRLESM